MLWRQGDLDAHRVLLRQLLAALIDDEEVMECSEGWRRDVKTVMKCSPSVVREHIVELLVDLDRGRRPNTAVTVRMLPLPGRAAVRARRGTRGQPPPATLPGPCKTFSAVRKNPDRCFQYIRSSP